MLPGSRRAALLALLVLLVAPHAAAQLPSVEEPIPLPDLIPGNTRINATDETRPVEICVEVLNVRGDQRTTHGPFDIVLVVDGFEAGVSRVRETLSSGEGTTACWSLRLDRGVHRYHWIADAGREVHEHDEDNNVAIARSFTVSPPPKPDLHLEMFDVFPKVGTESRPQSFRAFVRNIGNAPAPASHVTFVDDTGELGVIPLKALAPGEIGEAILLTYPALRPAGFFVARATVDEAESITEWNETNNAREIAYEIAEHPLPDLRVANVTLEGSYMARESMWLNITVENVGDRGLPPGVPLVLRIYDNERSVANETRPALEPGRNTTFRLHIRMSEGEHALRFVVDPDGKAAEHDEDNNALTLLADIKGKLTLNPDAPNLVLERLDGAPNDPRPGETVRLIALVHNPSNNTINASVVEFTVNGEPLGTALAPALSPGRSASVTYSWPVQAPGNYTIRARVDPADEIEESDDGDNEVRRTFIVVEPAPPTPTRPTPATPTTPTTPTPATPTTPPPATPTPTTPGGGAANGTRVLIGDVDIRASPSGSTVVGSVTASLRNPVLEPVGRMSVVFRVDGRTLKAVLVEGIGGGGTAPAPSGDIELPPGRHVVEIEVRDASTAQVLATATKEYDVAADESAIPAPGAPLVAAAAVAAALALARGRRRA